MTTDFFFFFEVSVDDESSIEWPEVRFFVAVAFAMGFLPRHSGL